MDVGKMNHAVKFIKLVESMTLGAATCSATSNVAMIRATIPERYV